MNEENDVPPWVRVAEEDYALARSARRHRPPLTYGVCFHAQQCAEKYLKAVLVARGRPFPKVHDLVALNDLCVQSGLFLGIADDDLDVLSAYAVRTRYPGLQPAPEEASQALKIAKAVRVLVRRHLGIET